MNAPTQAPSKELTQRDLYKPENVVAFLRSIQNNSIAGKQYCRAADEIESLHALLMLETAALEQACCAPVDAPLTVQQARAVHEPPAPASNDVSSERLADLLASCIMQSETGGHADDYNAFLCDLACVCMELQRRRTSLEPAADLAKWLRQEASFWRDDAFENAAKICERYEAHDAARDIRHLKGSSQPPLPEWQPIETAPKDERDFLGWECGSAGIYYRTPDTPDDAAISHGTASYPTHWMPLPSPPTKGPAQ